MGGRPSLGRASGAASVSGKAPVRVQVHRKLHKDLAELCQVQTLPGHQGKSFITVRSQVNDTSQWQCLMSASSYTACEGQPCRWLAYNNHFTRRTCSKGFRMNTFISAERLKRGSKTMCPVVMPVKGFMLIGVVWAMKFSHDGKFLATAGQDRMVYVWKVKAGRGEGSAVPSNGQTADQSRNGNSAGTGSCHLQTVS